MSTLKLATLYYYSCELSPDLPSTKLMNVLGPAWSRMLIAGAKAGLVGTPGEIGECSFEQCVNVYSQGAEAGSAPDLESFRSGLASSIYEKLCESDLPTMEKVKMSGELWRWSEGGKESTNGNDILDFDAESEFPMFTKTGFMPLDKIAGEQGVAQELVTILGKPGVGKTSIALSIAHEWRRRDIGPVSFIQSEMSHAAMRMKISGQAREGEKLWRSGVDRIAYGNAAFTELKRCEDEPDGNRLLIWDSTTGTCGTGDSSEGRLRYVKLYEDLMRVKNSSRLVIACGHVKRGDEMIGTESGAGSAIVERLSGIIIGLESEDVGRPDGMSEIRISAIKNRYAGKVRPFTFGFDYATGQAYDSEEW